MFGETCLAMSGLCGADPDLGDPSRPGREITIRRLSTSLILRSVNSAETAQIAHEAS